MTNGNEKFYARYDQALALLPPELQSQADVRRVSIPDQSGDLVFHNEFGAEIATVHANNTKTIGPRKPPKPPPELATKQYVSDVTSRKVLNAADALTKSLAEQLDSMKDAVDSLRRKIGTMEASTDAVMERLDRTEESLKDVLDSTFRYRGYWRQGVKARRGETFTEGGQLWFCINNTTERPTNESVNWQIAVRRGRDGRDRGTNYYE